MSRPIADPHGPYLRIGNAFTQLVAGPQLIGINREFSALDVDRCKLAHIGGLEFGLDVFLVHLAAAAGELFLAVAWLGSCHGFPLNKILRRSGVAPAAFYLVQDPFCR